MFLTMRIGRPGGRLLVAMLSAAAVAMAGLAGEARAATMSGNASIVAGAPLTGGTLLDIADRGTCGTATLSTTVGSFSASGSKARLACKLGPSIKTRSTKSLAWDVGIGKAFTAVSFALKGARSLRRSSFTVDAEGATWSIASRQKKGKVHWVTVLFDQAVTEARISFKTRRKDNFSIHEARVAPIPLPPAALLLGAGIVALGGLGGLARRRAAA